MVFRRWAWLSKRALLVIVFLKQANGGILPWFLSLSFYSFFLCPLWMMGSVHICMSTLVHSIDHSDAFIQHTKKLQDKASCLPSFYINVSPSLHIDIIENRIASRACKAAIKGNQKMSKDECKKLLEFMLTLKNPYQCPHGRPTLIRISKTDLEKMFKRIVS